LCVRLFHHLAAAALVLVSAVAHAAPPTKPASPAPAKPASPEPAKAPGTPKGRGATAKLAPPSGAQRLSPGKSLGAPNEGHLVGGARLAEAPYLRILPVYASRDARWGLEPFVAMIDRAARLVRKKYPDAVLSVGDLSRKGGGPVDRHASHESGRDADIGFFVKNQRGKPVYADHFVPFTGDGKAKSWPGAEFDDARNWSLVSAMLGDGRVRVTHIFISRPLRARLLRYAQRIGAPASIRERAALVMLQPRGAQPHDDHFHVRIACPAGMKTCVELPQARRKANSRGAIAAKGHAAPAPKARPGKAAAPTAKAAAPSKQAAPPPSGHEPDPVDRTDDAGEERDEREGARTKTESYVPILGPIVPGLDSVVIPTPLRGSGARRSK
jgi:penicillin-insensitive murein DD-endopeptidase